MITTDEYMSKPVVTAQSDIVIQDVCRLMDEKNIGSIAIVDGEQLVGIVTERDIVRKVIPRGIDVSSTAISEVMTNDVITVDRKASLMEVAALMKEHTMRRLIVLEEGRPVGIITSRDLIGLLV